LESLRKLRARALIRRFGAPEDQHSRSSARGPQRRPQVPCFGSVQESRDAAPMRISFTHIPDPELEQD